MSTMKFAILYHPFDETYELFKLSVDRLGYNSRKPLPRNAQILREIVVQRYGEGSIYFKGFIEGLKHTGKSPRVRPSTPSPRPKKDASPPLATLLSKLPPAALESMIMALWKGKS